MVLLEVLAVAAYLHYRQQKKIKKLEAALTEAGVPVPDRKALKRCGKGQQWQWQGNVRGGGMVPQPPVQPQQQQQQQPVRYYDDEKKNGMMGGEGNYYADEKARAEVNVEEKLPQYGVFPGGNDAQETQQYTHPSTWDNDAKDYNEVGNPTMNKFDDWVDVQVAKGRESIKGYLEKVNPKPKES